MAAKTRSLDELLTLALDETREAFERLPPVAMAPWVNNSGEVVRADPHHAGCCAARAHTFVRLAQGRAEDLRARAERAEAEVARLRDALTGHARALRCCECGRTTEEPFLKARCECGESYNGPSLAAVLAALADSEKEKP